MPYYPEEYHAVPDAGRMNEISFKIGEILRDVIYDVMRIDKVEEEKENSNYSPNNQSASNAATGEEESEGRVVFDEE